jgi:elongator complex protein 1
MLMMSEFVAPISIDLFSQVALHSLPELVTEIIYPAALGSISQITEEVSEMKAQLGKQTQRIRELRIRKLEEPG